MAGATPKGFPYPAGTPDDNANQDSILALANRLDTILSARTAAQITALSGADLWNGRLQRQTDSTGTTTRQQTGLYVYEGAWKPLVGDGHGGTANTPTLTATTTNPTLGTSPTNEWDWWMLGPFLVGSITIIWGTGAPTPGSGTYEITLPVAPASISTNAGVPLGWGQIKDASTGAANEVVVKRQGTVARMFAGGITPSSGVIAGTPLTLGATGDEIKLFLCYPT
jgi:hypothetical protein